MHRIPDSVAIDTDARGSVVRRTYAAATLSSMDTRFAVAPYDYAAAERLSAELGVSHVLAQVLVRRGLGDLAAARAFLAAADAHPLDAFGGLREGASAILGHVARRSRITVHGDYDVDGVTATAILVRALRTLGADVDWYLPSRIDDGYGLAASTVERLAERGTDLLVTVDCAITAVEEVAAARAAGLDVVVTDHHSPRADGALPDAPIVHPRLGGNPCADLCAAGVAYKLAQALLEGAGEDPRDADEDLDLVALATVADVVPLVGENRRLVRDGLRALAETRKPGLRALMEIARVDPSAVDAGAIGFRLAPRINAAGRLHRADAGLELLLTEDPARARAIAAELDAVNAERRDVETRIRFAAEAQVAEQGPAPAYVLAAEGWHPGVIGIVAARIAERHHRPAVLIALDGAEGTGSGRSIPAFDLLGGLTASGRAPRPLRRPPRRRRADDRARRTSTRSGSRSPPTPPRCWRRRTWCRRCAIDAVVAGDVLTLALAEELERLAPFGHGNPPVSLLVPAAHLADPRAIGEGRHVAFTLHAGGARSRCVQFGAGSRLPVGPGRAGRGRRPARGEPLERRRRAAPGAPPRPPGPAGADRRARRARVRRRRRGRARRATSAAWEGGARDAGRPAPCARRARRRHRRAARGPRRRGRAGARGRRARAVPRAHAAGPDRRLRGLLVGGARGRPRPGGRLRPSGGGRPAVRRGCARAARTSVRRGRSPIWRGASLSYALLNAYISGTSPCATR